MKKILLILLVLEYLVIILTILQYFFNILGMIWYCLYHKRIHYNMLSLIYRYLYVDVRPTSYKIGESKNSSINFMSWGNKIIHDNDSKKFVEVMLEQRPVSFESKKFLNLTQFDAYKICQEVRKRIKTNLNKQENNSFSNKYFGAFIFHENKYNSYFHWMIEQYYNYKFKSNIIIDNLHKILNFLEKNGYIFRINGVIYEIDNKENIKYLTNTLNEGDFGITPRGIDLINGNKDISFLANNEIKKLAIDIININVVK